MSEDAKELLREVISEELKLLRKEMSDLRLEVALLKQEQVRLKEDQKYLTSGINRALWLIGGGFISSVVLWITKGGLFEK